MATPSMYSGLPKPLDSVCIPSIIAASVRRVALPSLARNIDMPSLDLHVSTVDRLPAAVYSVPVGAFVHPTWCNQHGQPDRPPDTNRPPTWSV